MKKIIWIIIFIVALFIVGKFSGVLPFSISPGARVVYPLYSSVCCEATGPSAWVSAAQVDIINYEKTWTCPKSTTQCRIKNPQITCPGSSISHPLGYQAVYSIKITQPSGISYSYSNLPFATKLPDNGKEFQPLGNVRYSGACIDRLIFISPTNWISLINLITGKGIKPTYGKLDIDYINTKLYRYPALEGKYDIPGTTLCQKNSYVQTYINQEPRSGYEIIAQKAKGIAEWLTGKELDAPKVPEGNLKDMPQQMGVGECYTTIDKWIELPEFGNVNPKGQYKGSDVICSPGKGIIKVETLFTVGGANYVVPTTRLTQPDKFCCNDEDCHRIYGIGYNCAFGEYSCKKVEGYCKSDLDCQPIGGEQLDKNCYKEFGENKFFTWSSYCTRSNTCSKAEMKEVKCCPSQCEAQGMWCDFEKGCMPTVPPSPPCPEGLCCKEGNAYNYDVKGCGTGLQCCDVVAGVGTCKINCKYPCNKNKICEPTLGENIENCPEDCKVSYCSDCFDLWTNFMQSDVNKCTPKDIFELKLLGIVLFSGFNQKSLCTIFLVIIGITVVGIIIIIILLIPKGRGRRSIYNQSYFRRQRRY